MSDWYSILKYNPVEKLLLSDKNFIVYFAERDFLDKRNLMPSNFSNLPEVEIIINKQQNNGSWKYPNGNLKICSLENYDQIESFRNLGYLIEMYGINRSNLAITIATNFLFGLQTDEGDIHGILVNQYTPYYTNVSSGLPNYLSRSF